MIDNDVLFSLPGLYQYAALNMQLLNLKRNFPLWFRENAKIDNIYGSFPCVWNGGRSWDGTFSINDVISAVTFLNSNGIKIRYTFTNCFIDEKIVYDTIGNAILTATRDNQSLRNGIIIANETMYNYIKENYPEFDIIYSTTMMIKDVDEINKYSEKHLIIPDYSINNDFEKLKKLEHPENIELLCNEECVENCKKRRVHYENNSLIQLKKDVEPLGCENIGGLTYADIKKRRHYISFENIEKNYIPLGINKFKIAGRSSFILKTVESYVDFFAKPEFAEEVRYYLLAFLLNDGDSNQTLVIRR